MPNQHVVPDDGQWAVRPAGGSRVTTRTDTQAEAIRKRQPEHSIAECARRV
jgi:hypothetical protein